MQIQRINIRENSEDSVADDVRLEYSTINRKDPEILRRFFLRFSFFSTNDLAQILGYSSTYIKRLKRSVGIRGRPIHGRRIISYPTLITAPPNWGNEWLRQVYPQFGLRIIARATSRTIQAIHYRLKRLGVILPDKTSRSKHPCCNEEWLRKYYVEEEWTATQCSQLAGVSRDTICDWLNVFKIQVRSNAYSILGKVSGFGADSLQDRQAGDG